MVKSSKKFFFGTDGIRGRANTYPITPEGALQIGQALGYWLQQKPVRRGKKRSVLIGKDTRLSGYMIEQALASGLNSVGVYVQLTGPLPTPGISLVTQSMRLDAGIMVSASHNPYQDNGIKIFDHKGLKLSPSEEQAIQDLQDAAILEQALVKPEHIGRTRRIDDALGRYIVCVKNTFSKTHDLVGLSMGVDCAFGAAYKTAPSVFKELGAKVILLAHTPNGRNINLQCGALHPQNLQRSVRQLNLDFGLALDGDADRCVLCDEEGVLLDGDHILACLALSKKHKSQLPHNTVVGTVMSSLSLESFLNSHGIKLVRVDVGDKNIIHTMLNHGYTLGGEPSGHILCAGAVGDGCVAALGVLELMREQKKPLSYFRKLLPLMPRKLLNLHLKEELARTSSKDLDALPCALKNALQEGQNKMAQKGGRLYARPSGTEPVLRVLLEGPCQSTLEHVAKSIVL